MRILLVIFMLLLLPIIAACSSSSADQSENTPALIIGGIPDQDVSLLEERFGGIASYLSDELDIDVQYRPSTDYAALVTAFRNGDVKLAWFGGLTGVQARIAAPGSNAIIQRPLDTEFHSVFVVAADDTAESLADLSGRSFTFGSESSTSGHLMPRHYLSEAGIDPEADFQGAPSYSGSHDTTWKLVETGSFDAGALNAAVWERAVREGQVDTSRVRLLETVGPYYDYHWVAHPSLDETYGEGTAEQIESAFIAMSTSDAEQARTLELFETDSFITTENSNYEAIEDVARNLNLIE